MAEEDDSQKTEDPTDKKKSKAREKGQVATSQEVKHWAVLFGGALGLMFMAPAMVNGVREIARVFIQSPHAIDFDPDNVRRVLAYTFLDIGIVLLPFIGVLVIIVTAASVLQTGWMWSPSKLAMDFSKLSLLKGFKRMFSVRAVLEFAKGIFKLALIVVVGYFLAFPLLQDITMFAMKDISAAIDRVLEVAIWFTLASIGVMTAIASLDFAYQKYATKKQLMMSKYEVKEEVKQAEGDPQIKARIRQIRTERAMQRMMAAVPEADVVITNPTHFAVALKYKMDDMQVPILVAKGVDSLALRIREVAEEHDVAIVENPPLARALYASVELEEEIPSEHYMAVAEIIGYVMRLRGELPPLQSSSGL